MHISNAKLLTMLEVLAIPIKRTLTCSLLITITGASVFTHFHNHISFQKLNKSMKSLKNWYPLMPIYMSDTLLPIGIPLEILNLPLTILQNLI